MRDVADVVKDKFVDRSSALGVGVRTGKPAASTPALEIGSGEFPHKLSVQFLYRGVPRETETFGMNPRVGDWTVKGWTNNWDFQFSLSASAMEAIGKSSPLAATRAIAALKAALPARAICSGGMSLDNTGLVAVRGAEAGGPAVASGAAPG